MTGFLWQLEQWCDAFKFVHLGLRPIWISIYCLGKWLFEKMIFKLRLRYFNNNLRIDKRIIAQLYEPVYKLHIRWTFSRRRKASLHLFGFVAAVPARRVAATSLVGLHADGTPSELPSNRRVAIVPPGKSITVDVPVCSFFCSTPYFAHPYTLCRIQHFLNLQ